MTRSYHTHWQKNTGDVGHAADVLLKIAKCASFVRITPGMVVETRKSNSVYLGDALNYKMIYTQRLLSRKSRV